MQEEIGEELLSLGLSLGSIQYCSEPAKKKRKRRDHEPTTAAIDEKLLRLIESRDRMLRVSPGRNGLEDGKGLQLIHLLLIAATAVDGDDSGSAVDSLVDLYRNASLSGDPIQRVAAYFADGLAARLSPLLRRAIAAPPAPADQFRAFTDLYRASPYYQFAHFTANQAIIDAFEGLDGRNLHVVDYDVRYGFQWPSLIQSLSDSATPEKPVSLRITGIGGTLEELEETKARLSSFAEGCPNLKFEFEGFTRSKWKASDLEIAENATLAVNLVLHLQNAANSGEIVEALTEVSSLKPSVVVLVEKEGKRRVQSFLSGFMESLHYFAAMFDSLDDCLSSESPERMRIERDHYGREIKNSVTISGGHEEKQFKYERFEAWKVRMERCGFEGIELSSRSVTQAKLLLQIRSHSSATNYGNSGGFRILEREGERAMTLAWQERHLITASVWRCVQRSI